MSGKKKLVHFTDRDPKKVVDHVNTVGVAKTDLVNLTMIRNRLWVIYWGDKDPMVSESKPVKAVEEPEELDSDVDLEDDEEYEDED